MKKHLLLIAPFLLFVIVTSFGQDLGAFEIRYTYISKNADLPLLRDCADAPFQTYLQKAIDANPVWKKLAAQKKLSVGLVDLRDMSNVKFAQINGDNMMYAASLPKIAILLAAMDAFEKKELAETPTIKKDLRLMISKSDNRASTRMIDRLGYAKIQAVLTDPKYNLYDEAQGGGLWVGKRYAAGGARNPDPLQGLSHAATATQICRFYYMMLQGKLVCDDRSQEMMECMVDPALHHKFVNTLDKIAPNARIFRKSGSWQTFHSDSIMVWGPDRQYILTALVNDSRGEKIIRDLVYAVEKVLHQVSMP